MDHFDKSKFIRQKEALTKWKDSDYRGILNLTMRFGKTVCAKYAIEHCIRLSTSDSFTTIAIAPNEITYNNLCNVLGSTTGVECYTVSRLINILKSLHSDDERHDFMAKYDLMIIDEIHKLIKSNTETSIHILPFISIIPKVLGLTGSVLTKDQIEYSIKSRIPVVDVITEDEAIANKWVSQYREFNLAIELEDHYKIKYKKTSQIIADVIDRFNGVHNVLNKTIFKRTIFNSDFDVAMSCFTGKYYRNPYGQSVFMKPDILRNMVADIRGWKIDLVLDNDYNIGRNRDWHPDVIYNICKNFKTAIKNRNDILIHNRNKLNAVIEILTCNSVPTICFNESTEMADLEFDYFKEEGIIYHSNVESRFLINPKTNTYFTDKKGDSKKIGKTVLKRLAIEGMRDGTYKYLFTAKALNEGVTIENIRQVIITGGDMNSQTHEQRTARGKSIDYNDFTKNCIVINLYIDDFILDGVLIKSRDKAKLMLRQGGRVNISWITSISDIFI